MDTSNTRLDKILFLKSISSLNSAYATQRNILHPIRTVFLYQFFQLTHNSVLIGVLQ